MDKYSNLTNFDELLDHEHGKIGSESRMEYEEMSQMFIISEMLKEARKDANLTQEQLAPKKATYPKSKMEKVIFNYQPYLDYLKWALIKRLDLHFCKYNNEAPSNITYFAWHNHKITLGIKYINHIFAKYNQK